MPKDNMTATDVKNEFGYSRNTLLRWEQQGVISPTRTPGGHRRYSRQDIQSAQTSPSKTQAETVATAPHITEMGTTGLRQWNGSVYEERLRELRGRSGRILKREMRLNDPVISAIFFGIGNSMRRADWRVKPYSELPADVEAAEFIESCMHDMSFTWSDTQTFIIDEMLEQGFSVLEIVNKRRLGANPSEYTEDPASSQYTDGRIGWRKWAIRPAESLADGNEWMFDDNGGVQGIRQAPEVVVAGEPRFVEIPIEKLLHFRTTVHPANTPEGQSIHRSIYTSWWYSSNIQELEGIGLERDLAGLPVVYLGRNTTKTGVNSDYELAKDLVVNIRQDEQMGVVIPHPKLGTSADGEGMLLELLSSDSRRQYNTNDIINRYDKRKAMAVMAQFIMLGMERVGSYALSRHQGDLFVIAVSTWMTSIADVINRHAIPKLLGMNVFPNITGFPKLVPGTIGIPDLGTIGDFINQMVGANVIEPDEEMERTLRQWAGLQSKPLSLSTTQNDKRDAEAEDEALQEDAEVDDTEKQGADYLNLDL